MVILIPGGCPPARRDLLSQPDSDLKLGSRPMLVGAALETMPLGDEVGRSLHHAIAFLRGRLCGFPGSGRLGFGGFWLDPGSPRLFRNSFLFRSWGRRFFFCGLDRKR